MKGLKIKAPAFQYSYSIMEAIQSLSRPSTVLYIVCYQSYQEQGCAVVSPFIFHQCESQLSQSQGCMWVEFVCSLV